jgi:hypothetical protein
LLRGWKCRPRMRDGGGKDKEKGQGASTEKRRNARGWQRSYGQLFRRWSPREEGNTPVSKRGKIRLDQCPPRRAGSPSYCIYMCAVLSTSSMLHSNGDLRGAGDGVKSGIIDVST